MSKTVTVTIDGRTIQAPQGSTILEVARREGIHVPTLCYTHLLPPWKTAGCAWWRWKAKSNTRPRAARPFQMAW